MCMYMYLYLYMHMCMYMYICICMYIYMYVYTYMYIYIYTRLIQNEKQGGAQPTANAEAFSGTVALMTSQAHSKTPRGVDEAPASTAMIALPYSSPVFRLKLSLHHTNERPTNCSRVTRPLSIWGSTVRLPYLSNIKLLIVYFNPPAPSGGDEAVIHPNNPPKIAF